MNNYKLRDLSRGLYTKLISCPLRVNNRRCVAVVCAIVRFASGCVRLRRVLANLLRFVIRTNVAKNWRTETCRALYGSLQRTSVFAPSL